MSKAASHYKEELISFAHVCFLISKKIVLITVTLELRMTFDVFADMTYRCQHELPVLLLLLSGATSLILLVFL